MRIQARTRYKGDEDINAEDVKMKRICNSAGSGGDKAKRE